MSGILNDPKQLISSLETTLRFIAVRSSISNLATREILRVFFLPLEYRYISM